MKSNGSALLVHAETREEALKVVESDVYTKSGVWDMSKVGVSSVGLPSCFIHTVRLYVLTVVQMQVFPFKSAVRKAL